jgi:urease accessory protein
MTKSTQMVRSMFYGVLLLCAWAPGVHAHHVMDYATPATMLEGLLAGLGHPVIGIDHLLFIVGAGVLAARVERGFLLPLVFVVTSTLAVGVRIAGPEVPLSELWVAGSIVILGAALLTSRALGRGVIAALFLLAGAIHGYALAEGIVGAERAPIFAYLAGLTIMLCMIAFAAWAATSWLSRTRPALPLYRMTGVALAVAGIFFVSLVAIG